MEKGVVCVYGMLAIGFNDVPLFEENTEEITYR